MYFISSPLFQRSRKPGYSLDAKATENRQAGAGFSGSGILFAVNL